MFDLDSLDRKADACLSHIIQMFIVIDKNVSELAHYAKYKMNTQMLQKPVALEFVILLI